MPVTSARGEKTVDHMDAVPYLDCLATLAEQAGVLYLAAINCHREQDISCDLALAGFSPVGGRACELNGDNVTASHDFDAPGNVQIAKRELSAAAAQMEVTFPCHSVAVLELAAG